MHNKVTYLVTVAPALYQAAHTKEYNTYTPLKPPYPHTVHNKVTYLVTVAPALRERAHAAAEHDGLVVPDDGVEWSRDLWRCEADLQGKKK